LSGSTLHSIFVHIVVLTCILGCSRDGAQPGHEKRTAAAESVATRVEEGHASPALNHVEFVTGGARGSDPLPLIVAIHGLGDRPESFRRLFEGLEARTRVLLPRAPTRYGDGYSWFTFNRADIDATSREIRSAANRIAAWLEQIETQRPTVGRPIVTGFSQGGILSFVIAVHHAGAVGEAYPVSGLLTASLVPKGPAPSDAPRIFALHGTADRVVPYGPAREGVEALKALGYRATLRSYEGVGHTISQAMRDDLYEALGKAATERSRVDPAAGTAASTSTR
jgi:phospholipase/carboxylesterase